MGNEPATGTGTAGDAAGEAANIPKPAHWSILGNGHLGHLVFYADAEGRVTGTVFGDQIIGFWDEETGKLTFVRIPKSKQPDAYQFYTGYRFSWSEIDGSLRHGLAGAFEAFAGTGAKYQRVTFGWYGLLDPSPSHDDVILFQDMKAAENFGGSFINANGSRGKENLSSGPKTISIDPMVLDYPITGTVFGDQITGFADPDAGRIAFVRIPPPPKVIKVGGDPGGKPDAYQVYTGYSSVLAFGNEEIHVVAGSFVAFAGTLATTRRTVYGWYGVRPTANASWT